MSLPVNVSPSPGRWTSLWIVALLSMTAQLAMCQFFSFGEKVPITVDINPSNLWTHAYQFPPTGSFEVLNWLGVAYLPQPLNPFSLASLLSPWFFFTFYAPLMATLALLAMAAFLREFELSRPAALVGAVVYAWQGDLLPFVYPAHYGYITTWPFFAVAAWGALRAQRTRHWVYAVISGAGCGMMVELQPDRGAIASLLVAALYLATAWRDRDKEPVDLASYNHFRLHGPAVFGCLVILVGAVIVGLKHGPHQTLQSLANWGLIGLGFVFAVAMIQALRMSLPLRHLALCTGVALLISLASFLALFQSNIVGVKLAGEGSRAQTYKFVTQYCLAPAETLTYLVPGVYGWSVADPNGPYWGWIGEWPDFPEKHQGPRNSNNAISTTGTVGTVLALIGTILLLPGVLGRLLGPNGITERQRFYGRVLLGLGLVTLVLSWGWHTPLYRPLFELPLMDKWRNPLKWLEMTNFALAVLSAIGAQQLVASVETAPGTGLIRRRLGWFCYGVLGLLFLGLMLSYPFTFFRLAAGLQADGFDLPSIANAMSMVHYAFLVALAFMALFCSILYALWRPEWLRKFSFVNPWLQDLWVAMLQARSLGLTLALGLVLLCAGQLGWVALHFVQPVALDRITRTNGLLDQLWGEGDTVRVSAVSDDPVLNNLLLNQFFDLPHPSNKLAVDAHILNQYKARISCLDISAASRIPDDIKAFFDDLADNESRLWFLAGVKNVAAPQEDIPKLRNDPLVMANLAGPPVGYTLVPTGSENLPSHAVVQFRDYMAKATFVPHAEVIPDRVAMLKRLKDPAWNPRDTVLLSAPAEAWIGAIMPPTDGPEVVLKTYSPTEIKVSVNATTSGFLLINDQYDPDWETEVNGEKVELLRADFIMRAVHLRPGESNVTMRYVPHYHLGGLNLSAEMMNNFSDAAMLAAWGIAGWVIWRRREPLVG